MTTFTFEIDGRSYTANTMLETDSGFFVDPVNNDCDVLQALEKYRQEQEDIAFQNQPPELFKFYWLKFSSSDGRSYSQLIGAANEKKAIALLKKWEAIEDD